MQEGASTLTGSSLAAPVPASCCCIKMTHGRPFPPVTLEMSRYSADDLARDSQDGSAVLMCHPVHPRIILGLFDRRPNHHFLARGAYFSPTSAKKVEKKNNNSKMAGPETRGVARWWPRASLGCAWSRAERPCNCVGSSFTRIPVPRGQRPKGLCLGGF